MPNLQGYKTIAVNALLALSFGLKAIVPDAEVPGVDAITSIVDQTAAWVVAGVAFANIILRVVTTTPVFKKEV